MPYKNKEKRKERKHEWYEMNKEETKKVNKTWRNKNKSRIKIRRKSYVAAKKKEFDDYKATLKCAICGEDAPECLDFHHLNQNEKEHNIGEMRASGLPLDSIKKEIAKCIVVCSNCHRKIHSGRIKL